MQKDKIGVIYGQDMQDMVQRLMTWANVADELHDGMHIAIKPNLVVAKTADSGATTHIELIEGVIDYLQAHGRYDITIMEGSWVGDSTKRAFAVCGFDRLAKKKGVRLLDLKGDSYQTYDGIRVCDAAMKADYLINMPVLKGHCQTTVTCALKNMKGVIPDAEKRRFHAQGLHQPIAKLATIIRPNLTIVDGICGDLDFEEGGNPVPMNRVMIGCDSVLIDACVCRMMGVDVSEVPYIELAARLGAGSMDFQDDTLVELNDASGAGKMPPLSRRARALGKHVDAREACSACYGSLIHALYRLDEMGRLGWLSDKVCIGQGFRGQTGGALGVGNCARGCDACVGGCPPRADQIMEFLQDHMK
jgi:uncharacterized protein (DUF362 family)